MRSTRTTIGACTLAALSLMAAAVMAQPPVARPLPQPRPNARLAPAAPVIGTHQIDRYAAIAQLQQAVKAKPDSLSDWIMLGELAHEVGVDSAPEDARQYHALSRQAYEKALALAPNKPGLKAAVQFARDYEAGTDRFAQIRARATQSYLDARRRDLAATDYVPAVRVYPAMPSVTVPPASATVVAPSGTSGPPAIEPAGTVASPAEATPTPAVTPPDIKAVDTTPAITPAPTQTASTDIANFGTRQIYTSPYAYYQPLALPQGAPYTYQQYSSAYYPAGLDNAGQLPVTLQRYAIQHRVDASRPTVNPAYTAPRPTPTTPP